MNNAIHPSTVIDASLVQTLRALSSQAETQGRLQEGQLDIIYKQGWFNLYVPKEYGGLALSLPEALHIEEALAWADGSLGWTVTLCSGANWFAGFLAPSAAQALFADPKVCLAGSGKPSGIAKLLPDGYEVTGQWNYATGALHATAFTANCMIEKEGALLQDPAGGPLIQSFWFFPHEVKLVENWHSMGMIATGSHGYTVEALQVPFDRSFVLQPGRAVLPHPVYHFPFLQFAEATLAVNYSGMAIHFLDLCQDLFEEKVKKPAPFNRPSLPPLLSLLQNARQELDQARTAFYTTIDSAWQAMVSTGSVAITELAAISCTSRRLATLSRQQVETLYPYCGLAAAHPSTEINRVWRDLHTASQHSLLVYPQE